MGFIVGLTGGIASGKTTVATLFEQEHGINIVDADVIAREVVALGTPALEAIKARYGEGICHENGDLNRRALREKIFAQTSEKNWLNQLLHPLIREEIHHQLTEANSPYVLLVVPLLIENNMQSMVNRILVVDAQTNTQSARAAARDKVSKAQIAQIIAAQISRDERLKHADDVIINESDLQSLKQQVKQLHESYMQQI